MIQEKRQTIDFQDGGRGSHLGFPIERILAIFDLQVTLLLPTKFQVNWPLGSGEEEKNRFSRWWPRQPSWMSNRTISAIFDIKVTMMFPTKFQVSWPFDQEQKLKTDFQVGGHGSHLGFPIGTNLVIFDLQVILMLPTKFQVSWPFGSEEAKNRFSIWQPWQSFWISDQNDFNYF